MSSWTDRTVTNEHLLPYVDSNNAAPDVQAALRTLPFERNIFKLLANAPAFFPTFMKLLSCGWSTERSIRSKDFQMTVLRTAVQLDAPYEWDVNEPVAQAFGYTDEQLAAIKNSDVASMPPRQQLIVRIVDQLCAGKGKVDEDLVRQGKETFGDTGLMEIFFLNGVYGFLARTMNSCKIDFDEPIPGLADTLRKYNAATIEKESKYED